MFKHYLTTALRSFRHHWAATSVNIIGLTLGLACLVGALSIVEYYKLDDSQYRGSERTYFLTTEYAAIGKSGARVNNAGAPWVVAEYLKSQLENDAVVARMTADAMNTVTVDGKPLDVWFNFADAEFLKIFPIPFLFGDSTSALSQPHSAIVTESTAIRLFGHSDVLGKTVLLYGKEPVTIVGVTEAPPQPSHLGRNFEMLISMDVLRTTLGYTSSSAEVTKLLNNWSNASGPLAPFTYVHFSASKHDRLPALNDQLATMSDSHRFAVSRNFSAYPIPERRTRNLSRRVENIGLSWTSFLLISGGVVLLASCLNYANLATAVLLSRRKEFGVRRVIGANTRFLSIQLLIESALTTASSCLLAMFVLVAINPIVIVAFNVNLIYAWTHSLSIWAWAMAVIATVCMAMTIFPMLALRHANVATALRHSNRATRHFAARWMVATQFMLASGLLIAILLIRIQHEDMRRSALASLPDPIVTIDNNLATAGVTFSTLRSELLQLPFIESVTGSTFAPWSGSFGLNTLSSSPEVGGREVSVMSLTTSANYFSTFKIEPLAGSMFKGTEDAADAKSKDIKVIIDRSAARQFGWDNPNDAIGKAIYPGSENKTARSKNLQLHVIGVVADKESQFEAFGATSSIYFSSNSETLVPIIRLQKNHIAEGLSAIDSTWHQLAPSNVLHRTFVDERIEQSIADLHSYGKMISWIALLAFAIAMSGLIGMSVFAAHQRRHEIGVRRTLGARTTQVTLLLLQDFLQPVFIGSLIAWPVAYFATRGYLNQYIHRANFSTLPFLASLAISLFVSCIAVSWQAVRAARLNPASVLRHE